ncbi:MAG: PAS domain-containing protein [Capnocytophaga sp.]|nr:PAS domain-containing protein [Capnocytophaga sp.]
MQFQDNSDFNVSVLSPSEKTKIEHKVQVFSGKYPTPINEEKLWNKTEIIISTTDKYGTITFANDTFSKVCEYSKEELLGQPHSIIRHPDMPKIIFKTLWDAILKGNNFHGIVKNLTKTGKYYWVITNFCISRGYENEITSFMAMRKAVPSIVIEKYIAPLYKKLLEIERIGGIEASEQFMKHFTQKTGKSYTEFIYEAYRECGQNTDFLSESVTFGKNPFSK